MKTLAGAWKLQRLCKFSLCQLLLVLATAHLLIRPLSVSSESLPWKRSISNPVAAHERISPTTATLSDYSRVRMAGDLSDDAQVFIVAIDEASREVHPWDTPPLAPWRTPASTRCIPGQRKTAKSMIH